MDKCITCKHSFIKFSLVLKVSFFKISKLLAFLDFEMFRYFFWPRNLKGFLKSKNFKSKNSGRGFQSIFKY